MVWPPTTRTRMYTLAWVDEFVPFVVLFTLWFDDNGVDIAELSLAFIVWGVAILFLEVPTGALADRVDRRRLVGGAFWIRAVGIAVWLIWPSFAGLLIGAVLWAIHDALASGAWEALIHDQLVAAGDGDAYAIVMARVGQFSNLGQAGAALAATSLIGVGASFATLGWASVAVHLVSFALVVSLPDVGWVVDEARAAGGGAGAADAPIGFVAAVRSTARDRTVAIVLGVGALLGGLAVIDEYVPLLARRRGLSDALVPLAFLTVWVGLLVGGEIAARHSTMRARSIAAFLTLGALFAIAALLVDSVWALPLVGITYAAIETTWVIGDARLQARVPSHVRATVTSIREFAGGLIVVFAFGAVGLLTSEDDPTAGLIVVGIGLAIVGVLAAALPDD